MTPSAGIAILIVFIFLAWAAAMFWGLKQVKEWVCSPLLNISLRLSLTLSPRPNECTRSLPNTYVPLLTISRADAKAAMAAERDSSVTVTSVV
jgi:hypothetical protein